jgi:hypothetical protein
VLGAAEDADNTGMRRPASTACIAALAAAHLFAQDEAISLRLPPRPDQVIHYSMEHEVDTRMEGAPFEVHGRTVAALTQTVGERDTVTGRLESTMTYDNLSMDITLNGNTVPAPALDVTGKTMTLVFGSRAGADATLRVGETTTLPFAAGMPMPSGAALPMALNGQTRIKLLGIRRVDGERIARLDQIIEASMTSTANDGVAMTMKASGGGVVEWNLDRGYVTTGTTTIELEADVMQAKMHGRISTIVRGSN